MSISQNYPIINPSLNLSFALTKKLDPRITYSRASTATYYDGKTVTKAEENLFIYSQEFDNAIWAKGSTTVTANSTTAPDGTTTADLVIPNAVLSSHRIYRSFPATLSGNNNMSFYLKGGGYNFAMFYFLGGTAGNVQIDLTDGSASFNPTAGLGADFSGQTTVTAEANGFYRVSVSLTSAHTSFWLYFYETVDTATFSGNGTDGVYLWGAQLEARDTVTAYTPTTTQPITNYIPTLLTAPANSARFDHDPVTGESLGLLVEEQRTNLLLYSEDFGDASWSKVSSTVTANTVVAPDGALTMDLLIPSTSSVSYLYQSNTSGGASRSFTVFAKKQNKSVIWLYHYSSANYGVYYVDLTDGSTQILSGSTATGILTVVNVGNGIYKITVSFSSTEASNAAWGIGVSDAKGAFNVTGDGYSGIYIWGAQLEAGAFPTSYVKTQASQVTRSADSASMTGTNFSDWYRADEGSIYVEARPISLQAGGNNATGISDGTSSNAFYAPQFTNGNIFYYTRSGAVDQAGLSAGFVPQSGVSYKSSFGYKVNDFAASFNGGTIKTDTFGILPSGVNRLTIGDLSVGYGQRLTGCISKIAYYPQRLTNTQLQALTS